jgi:ubiquinone biosynthesis protein
MAETPSSPPRLARASSPPAEGAESILGVAVRDAQRLREVLAIVWKHGFGEVLTRIPFLAPFLPARPAKVMVGRAGDRFAALLAELGPTYIKLGQVLSMRSDLLPDDWIKALVKLQDRAPEIGYDEVARAIEEGLGQPLSVLFAELDPKPLATASIAQTHVAMAKGTGAKLVVKVQRPGIASKMRGDLDLLYLAAKALEASIEEARLVQPSAIVTEFEKGLLKELNFTSELANLVTVRRLLDPKHGVVAPLPHPELSCRTVLTMDYFEGKSVRELPRGTEAAKKAIESIISAMCKGIFADGVFHGDPHAGNILVGPDGTLCFLDFGLVGTLSPEQRDDLVTLVLGTILNDASTVARVLLKIGTPTQRVNIGELKADITRVRAEYVMVSQLSDLDSKAFVEEFVRAAGKYRVRLATEYAVLGKAAGTIEGMVRALYPDLDFIPLIRPHVESAFQDRWKPEELVTQALGGATGVASLLRTVPTHVDQILHDFETGNIQIRPVVPKLDLLPDRIHDSSSRVGVAIFAGAMSMCAALSLPTPWTGEWGTWHDWLRTLFFLIALASSAAGWTTMWWWHWLGRGQRVRLEPFLRFFRRG